MNLVEIRVINVHSPLPSKLIEHFCLGILGELGGDNWSLSVVLCDDSFIANLNEKYRGITGPTDVLSFPQDSEQLEDELEILGDVVVSLEYMERSALEFNTSAGEELERLIVHGILHLKGLDHEKDAVDGEMFELQDEILGKHAGELVF